MNRRKPAAPTCFSSSVSKISKKLVPQGDLNCRTGVVSLVAKDPEREQPILLPPEQLAQKLTPAELVAGIAARERIAEEELIDRYRRGVQVVLRRTVNTQDVEDLSQEVFMRAIEKIREGEVREPERLARNLALGHLRKAVPVELLPINTGESEDRSEGPLGQLLREEDDSKAPWRRAKVNASPMFRSWPFRKARNESSHVCSELVRPPQPASSSLGAWPRANTGCLLLNGSNRALTGIRIF